ncbi:MAG: MFS transporter [Prevotellaceae bacterium]|jgi:fucose permease|nr:MFS transporter [Prevotellaceae bacterium]
MKPTLHYPFIAACAGLAFFGVTMFAIGPILSQLGEGANALPATLSIGIILGTVIFGPVVDRSGYKWMLVAGALLALSGIQGLAHFRRMDMLHLSMIALGTGGGILNGATNALVSSLYDDAQRGMKLSILGAFYCIGALLWTLLNYFSPTDYTFPLNSISAVMALFILFFTLVRFPAPKPQGRVSLKAYLNLLKYPSLWLFALILFFQSGFEGVSGNFTAKFLENEHGLAKEAATLSLTWFTVGMLFGRFFLGYLMKKAGDSMTLYAYLTIAIAGVSLLYFTADIIIVYLAMSLIGLGVGATYPVIFNYLGRIFKQMSGTVFSIAIFIALWGQFVFNKIVGLLFDKNLFEYFPAALILAAFMMMILLPVAKKK